MATEQRCAEIRRDKLRYAEIRRDTWRDAASSKGSLCKTSAKTCFEKRKIGEGGVIEYSIFVPMYIFLSESLL